MGATSTTFKPNPALSSSLMDLPIMKHFSEDELKSSLNKMTSGTKNLYWFLKLGTLVGTGFLVWKYVLPTVFKAIGQYLALGATAGLIVLTIMCLPAISKFFKWVAKSLNKAAIRQAPFEEFVTQRKKMVENQQVFRVSKGKISALKNDMEVEARTSESDAKNLQGKILTLQTKATNLKSELELMVKNGGAEARNSDEYVNGNAELLKLLSESARVSNQLTQSQNFIQKYGSRAAIMKKFGQKLVMVETSMEIKLADFDATVEMLKKDYDFSQKSKAATNAAKEAMLFTKSWELEYAMDVVTSTIASDIAITAGNLKDIDTLTSQYSLDSDELYTNLSTLADNIRVGNDVVPSAKKYSNPEYKLTTEDAIKSGGFQDLM